MSYAEEHWREREQKVSARPRLVCFLRGRRYNAQIEVGQESN